MIIERPIQKLSHTTMVRSLQFAMVLCAFASQVATAQVSSTDDTRLESILGKLGPLIMWCTVILPVLWVFKFIVQGSGSFLNDLGENARNRGRPFEADEDDSESTQPPDFSQITQSEIEERLLRAEARGGTFAGNPNLTPVDMWRASDRKIAPAVETPNETDPKATDGAPARNKRSVTL